MASTYGLEVDEVCVLEGDSGGKARDGLEAGYH